ncbi:MAG: LysR substrate-binding domain-containing protein, partial [Parvibaculaceae bacterium]
RLAALATAAYAAPGFLAQRTPGRLLPEEDWIGFEDSLGHLLSADWLRRNVDGGRIVCRANSLLALREAARAGMGVAALPCYLADPDSDLRRIGGPIAEMEVSLWLLTHPDLRRVARVRTVIDFLAEALAQHRSLIEGRDSRE